MVDEIYEVNEYIAGRNIDLNNLYRICFLMVRWYKQQGYSKLAIRDEIFDWGEKHGVFFKFKINSVNNRVFDREQDIELKSPTVKINKRDIEEINRRFDEGKSKLAALAILCYAKGHADKHKEFSISSVGLSAWTGISRKALCSRYIKELIDYEYLTVVKKSKRDINWSASYNEQSTRYRINVPIHNSGEFTLKDNDLRILFSQVFANQYEY